MNVENTCNKKYKYRRLIVLTLSLAFLCTIYYLQSKSNFNGSFSQKIPYNPSPFKQWIGEDRPTLIYAMPPFNWLGDAEALKRTILTVKKMGWNVLPQEDLKDVAQKSLRNAVGIYVNDKLYSKSDIISIQEGFPKALPLLEIHWIPSKENIKNPVTYLATKNPLHPNVQAILASSYYPIEAEVKSDNLKLMMSWYPTVSATYYQPQPTKLMYCGSKRLDKTLWKRLDNSGYFVVYGLKMEWQDYQSHQGYIPADGESFVRTINQNGIYLILHSEPHLKEGAPTGRIFEAAAAAAVIISDKHPFIEREFQDSVLYIDTKRSDVFEQIETHMKWIKENPEEARKKARLAHAIFLEKFTLEQQVARLYKNLVKLDVLESIE